MKRKAVIIDAGKAISNSILKGTKVDAEIMRAYLNSLAGGAWDDHEIVSLENPSVGDVSRTINSLKGLDFSFVAFSGHGEHPSNSALAIVSRICLSDGELEIHDLNAGNDRCHILTDACRVVAKDVLTRSSVLVANAQKMASLRYSRADYRKYFMEAVLAIEPGPIYSFGCDINETAGESPKDGGYYTSFLIKSAEEWWNSTGSTGVLDSTEAHTIAAQQVTKIQPQQHPQYVPGRRTKHLPFAVKLV